MKRWWHLLLPVAGLLFQAVPLVFVHLVAALSYGAPRVIPEAFERPFSLAGLACCAGISILCGSFGAYGLLTRARLLLAIPLIAICCIPAAIGGAVYLHALLIFLTLI